MNRFILAIMAVMMLLLVACAGSGGTKSAASGASDNGGLPEIAAVDDAALEALPDVIAAE